MTVSTAKIVLRFEVRDQAGTGLLAIIQVSPVTNIILLLLEATVCDSFSLVQKYGYVKSLKPNN